jgi:hypothetical protein
MIMEIQLMEASIQSMNELINEQGDRLGKISGTTKIIAREFSEWMVSLQGILSEVVSDAREQMLEIDLERLVAVVKRIDELIDYSFIRIVEKLDKQEVDFFKAVDDGNKLIRDLIVDKVEKGFLGVYSFRAFMEEKINDLPRYSIDQDKLVAMIEKLDDVNRYNHQVAELNSVEMASNSNVLGEVNKRVFKLLETDQMVEMNNFLLEGLEENFEVIKKVIFDESTVLHGENSQILHAVKDESSKINFQIRTNMNLILNSIGAGS